MLFAVGFSTKCSDHGLDAGADHGWIDDTDLYIWIPFFRIGGLGVMVWMLALITRGSTTQACTCGSCLPHWRPQRAHGQSRGC